MLKIYEDKNTKDFISMVKHFSLDSLSENEINENFIREIKVEKNMNEYSEELKKFKKQKENMWENYLKKYDYKSSWIDKNQKPNDLLSLKELTDLLKYLSNINIHRNKLIEDEIVKKMTGLVISHKNDPKYFGKYLLIDFFITTEKFAKLSISDLIFDYPNILELHIFKILIDELCKECGIKENIGYTKESKKIYLSYIKYTNRIQDEYIEMKKKNLNEIQNMEIDLGQNIKSSFLISIDRNRIYYLFCK